MFESMMDNDSIENLEELERKIDELITNKMNVYFL